MICQDCNQRAATVHFTKIVQGVKNETHLCDECARLRQNKSFDDVFSIHNFLAGLLDVGGDSVRKQEYPNNFICSECGTTYDYFKKVGRLGCNNCYIEFKEKMNPLVRKIHGNTLHTGKVPKRTGGIIRKRRELQQLKLQLNDAINKQEFEKAAELRDKINELNRQILDM